MSDWSTFSGTFTITCPLKVYDNIEGAPPVGRCTANQKMSVPHPMSGDRVEERVPWVLLFMKKCLDDAERLIEPFTRILAVDSYPVLEEFSYFGDRGEGERIHTRQVITLRINRFQLMDEAPTTYRDLWYERNEHRCHDSDKWGRRVREAREREGKERPIWRPGLREFEKPPQPG